MIGNGRKAWCGHVHAGVAQQKMEWYCGLYFAATDFHTCSGFLGAKVSSTVSGKRSGDQGQSCPDYHSRYIIHFRGQGYIKDTPSFLHTVWHPVRRFCANLGRMLENCLWEERVHMKNCQTKSLQHLLAGIGRSQQVWLKKIKTDRSGLQFERQYRMSRKNSQKTKLTGRTQPLHCHYKQLNATDHPTFLATKIGRNKCQVGSLRSRLQFLKHIEQRCSMLDSRGHCLGQRGYLCHQF